MTFDLEVEHASIDPDPPTVCGLLEQKLEHLEEEWMPKERTISMVQLDADQRPPWDFRNSLASEWALTVNMVTSIIRGVLDASVGESLHVLKKNACREHPEFEFLLSW